MGKTYDQRKHQVADILREQSKTGRDIAPIPSVTDPDRRERCRLNFRLFCETYFSAVFNLAWSEDHLTVISIIENVTLNGGLSSVAMPRGSGKSSLCLAAAIWALVYGHRSYVVLIGASETHAAKSLKNIWIDFETNELLAEDFPEVTYPIRRLEHISKRALGQTLEGEPTRIGWTAGEIILPTVPGSVASGSRLVCAGITGAIRSLNAKLADGSSIRPDFALIDDPQTSESAQSAKQVHDRLAIVNGDILGLPGPKVQMSAVMPVTVIQKGDLADQVLDRKKNPSWQGIRTKMLKSSPTDTKLWEEYAEIWANSLRENGNIEAATEFYVEHKADLDAGAVASWPERYNPNEASAIQSAMNLRLRDEASFAAEYQNEPLSLEDLTPLTLTTDQVTAKANGIQRGIVPSYSTKLTAFVDVQGTVLYYVVLALGNDYTAHVVDYGTYPEQKKSYFWLREVSPTLADVSKSASAEGQIRAGLEALTRKLLDREWQRDDGATQQINRMMIDSGYKGDVVKQWINESGAYKLRLMASKGFGVKAESRPMESWSMNEKQGDRRGWNWIHNRGEGHVVYDTNSWKTFFAERIRTMAGEIGNLSIFKGSSQAHKLFGDHGSSEYPTATEGHGRTVFVWHLRPNRENHLLDCCVGCLVAASEQGILFLGHLPATGNVIRKRRKIEFVY